MNQPPVNTVPGPQEVILNRPLIFDAFYDNAISVADADAGSDPLKITLTATNGTIALAKITGLTFSVGNGTAATTMEFTGKLSDLNAALVKLSFMPDAVGPASLTIVSDDLGYSSTIGPQTDTDTIAITVIARPATGFLADKIRDELNDPANVWSQTFTAIRVWLPPLYTPAELKKLRVLVIAGLNENELIVRAKRQIQHSIAIAFRQEVNPNNVVEIDALVCLVEEVQKYWMSDPANPAGRRIAGTTANITQAIINPIASPVDLDKARQFFSVLNLSITEVVDA